MHPEAFFDILQSKINVKKIVKLLVPPHLDAARYECVTLNNTVNLDIRHLESYQ